MPPPPPNPLGPSQLGDGLIMPGVGMDFGLGGGGGGGGGGGTDFCTAKVCLG